MHLGSAEVKHRVEFIERKQASFKQKHFVVKRHEILLLNPVNPDI